MLIIKVTLEIRMLKSESRISTNVLQLEFRSKKSCEILNIKRRGSEKGFWDWNVIKAVANKFKFMLHFKVSTLRLLNDRKRRGDAVAVWALLSSWKRYRRKVQGETYIKHVILKLTALYQNLICCKFCSESNIKLIGFLCRAFERKLNY